MTIGDAIYLLCGATSLIAAVLLLRQYNARPSPLLLWSCIGFLGLAVNNMLVYVDFGVLPDVDLSLPRALVGALAMLALVYGLIRESGT
jgi:hypothetical protein